MPVFFTRTLSPLTKGQALGAGATGLGREFDLRRSAVSGAAAAGVHVAGTHDQSRVYKKSWLQEAVASLSHLQRTALLTSVGITLVCAMAGIWYTAKNLGLPAALCGVLAFKTDKEFARKEKGC